MRFIPIPIPISDLHQIHLIKTLIHYPNRITSHTRSNMADSLDDFFAKKDKKRRNKNQASALSAEALVRELEVGSKQSDYSSRRDGKSSTAMELLGLDANDNDWKDFEEVEKRDYTGLKVKEMSIQDQEEEQRRLYEQVEQVPESIPWKSKEETVAAIISSKDLNPYTYEMMKDDGEAATTADTPGEDADKAATSETQNEKSSESDTSKAVSSSTSTQDQEPKEPSEVKPTTATNTTPSQEGTPSAETTLAPKKEGDISSSSKASAKYVPPHERMASDVKVLEPVRLSKLTGPKSKASNQAIDIKDEKSFPSLG